MADGGANSDAIRSLRLALERERAAREICSELNGFVDLEPTLTTVITTIADLTGCEAVGVRLHDNGDYPYFVYDGFPDTFVLKENSLCSRNAHGERIPSADGTGYALDCMCGNIIRGRFDPSLEFFTDGGSFWSGHTTELLASTTEEDRQATTRNYCNSCGYESVALIPIKARGERVGLVQINDMRIGMFTEDLIEFVEMLGEQIGLAVHNSLVHDALKRVKEELARSNEDLEQFASAVSHDLQQPLSTVMGYVDLLEITAAPTQDTTANQYLRGIGEGTERMSAMIRDLLAIARVNPSVTSLQPVDLEGIIAQVESDLRSEISRSQASISYDPLPVVLGAPVQYAQLLQNLLGNALKFRGDARPEIHVGAQEKDGEWLFSVRDNGIGIEPSDMELVFKLFKRPARTKDVEGTGLGLALCKKIVERMSGRIWVESEPGQGSVFYFTLPRPI